MRFDIPYLIACGSKLFDCFECLRSLRVGGTIDIGSNP